jgi:hypothetical protein
MGRQALAAWEVVRRKRQCRHVACDHSEGARWQLQSTHETSGGAVGYARCVCGAWLVLLNGELLAAPTRGPSRARLPRLELGQ